MVNTRWSVAAASARGATHTRRAQPNQDAFAHRTWRDGRRVAVAVADGHGAPECFRSATGAALAVHVTMALLRDLLDGDVDTVDGSAIGQPLDAHRIVTRWRTLVERDVGERPVTADEETAFDRAADLLATDPYRAYGTTLLAAGIDESHAVLLQIGDGDIVANSTHGTWLPLDADPGLVANATTSLCLPAAWEDARSRVVPIDDAGTLRYLLLASDGYGNSFAEPSWRDDLMRDLDRLVADRGFHWVADQLGGWLVDSAEAAGDDTTAVLIAAVPSG